MAVPDGFRFSGGWFCSFAAAGCAAAGFEVLGSEASGLADVRFKQHQVHITNAAETTSVTKTTEDNSAKPDVWKAVGLFGAVSGRCDNLLLISN